MINELKPQKLVYRDGISQAQRLVAELDPDYIRVEERSLADFVKFANDFAAYLKFFNSENEAAGNWGAFLSGGFEYGSPDQLNWLSGLIAYAENGHESAGYANHADQFANPHIVLFITFLKLLGNIKVQLNQFTKQHLDLYYYQLLGLDQKKPIPDVVNFIVQLTNEVDELVLKKGTQVTAGKDNLGKDRVYNIQKDTLITKAAVAGIKSLYADKRPVYLADKWDEKNKLRSVKEMMSMALGYDTFDPDQFLDADKKTDKDLVSRTALKYQLSDDHLTAIIDLFSTPKSILNGNYVVTALTTAYRRLQIKNKQKQAAGLFAFIELLLADADGRLPNFNGQAVDENIFLQINKALLDKADTLRGPALLYATKELLLSVADFSTLAAYVQKRELDERDWAQVYALLDVVLQKKGIAAVVPPDTEWLDMAKEDDLKAAIMQGETGHARAFGRVSAGNTLYPAIGLAIASPKFVLNDGKRVIDIYLSCTQINGLEKARLQQELNSKAKKMPPFRMMLSADGGWKEIAVNELSFDDFIRTGNSTALPGLSFSNGKISCASAQFAKADVGNYVVDAGGQVYLIEGYIDQKNVEVTLKATVAAAANNQKYAANDVYLNALRIRLNMDEEVTTVTDVPVLPKGLLKEYGGQPMLAMVLNNSGGKQNPAYISWYQLLHQLVIQKIRVDIAVTGIRALTLQNDFSVLSPKKPFEPFGTVPQVGNRFYFSHSQLAGKAIDALTLDFEWLNAPQDFKAYYANYRKVADEEINNSNKPITGNEHFLGKLELIDNEDATPLGNIKLFARNAPVSIRGSFEDIPVDKLNTGEDVVNWKRYFSLELLTDFNHAAYTALLTKQALAYDDKAIRAYTLNAPYVPKIKQLTAGYTTSFEILPGKPDDSARLIGIEAFGYRELSPGNAGGMRLVPLFAHAGELFIGLKGLGRQQQLSLLFQLAGGTANPELPSPVITWSYLKNENWIALPASAVVSDTTNGLANTGLVEINIPGDISNTNRLLGDDLYWLKISVNEYSDAIPDLIDIVAQGVNALFINQGNHASHFTAPLAPGSIRATVQMVAGIKKLDQPFASVGGKPQETEAQFYVRVSERLRHKNRALAVWDYERLILGQFPEIYKVKCMPGTFSDRPEDIGKVDIIVITNTKGLHAFDHFQPKVPADLLLRITGYMEQRIPPFVSIKVRNPVYVKIKVKTGVRIKKGYSEAYYRLQLEQDLKQFLSPWAFDDHADIIIGGNIYHNAIVNFIARQPYIDHVATIKLLQSTGDDPYREVKSAGKAAAANPDMILVSAPAHDISLLTDDEFLPSSMAGIGYMQIDNDFVVIT
ncbi:baseplate J/gp47 family protein [Mucilaginibacter phyllosphaerae]|uniref:Uncharacterized protein n=1 Tax=Mucilaginibacter phyllosphaerae TaxID=1812349 RepID=A0A4Y8ADK9_9SPHI|nr:baseplate J/gp47 family protein [Mucilaginibacter phyllosphaerae]MBB3969162.1 hypothetical protein [Mucilaginibacter phyllosphaerae]TEW66028.1 hypothetical protein E2R65_12960 [Mucilaginibacter phyllosphaerae]GGH06711.1 hypothetical protein GCM10007352_11050 [Mucilaginibacter phyllosphaerae]